MSREGGGSTDVNTAKQSNLSKNFWVMGIVELLQLAVDWSVALVGAALYFWLDWYMYIILYFV